MMLRVLRNILCGLDSKVKVKGKKGGICDGVPSTAALAVFDLFITIWASSRQNMPSGFPTK